MTDATTEGVRRADDSGQYVYKTTLRNEYGLTQKMIEELGTPDKKCPNPHYRSGPRASLYLVSRVEKWVAENRERVEKVKAARAQRPDTAIRQALVVYQAC